MLQRESPGGAGLPVSPDTPLSHLPHARSPESQAQCSPSPLRCQGYLTPPVLGHKTQRDACCRVFAWSFLFPLGPQNYIATFQPNGQMPGVLLSQHQGGRGKIWNLRSA